MDTRQNQTEPAQRRVVRGRRSKTSLEWGPLVLAGVALVAVIAASIWAVAPGEGSPDPPEAAAPIMTSKGTDAKAPGAGWQLYLWDPRSGDVRTVSATPDRLRGAELSPDGEQVVYARQDADGIQQIYLLSPDGTERRLTDFVGGAFDPSWSPDGQEIAFAGSVEGDDSDIFVMEADGRLAIPPVGTTRDDGHPSWSPDGERLVFEGRHDYGRPGRGIWVASVRTHALARITPLDVAYGFGEPAWSPDGGRIAYMRFTYGTINGRHARELWAMRPDGTHRRRIGESFAFGERAGEPIWSPNGQMIALSRGTDLRVVLLDARAGDVRTVLTGSGSGELDASWSREGILIGLPSGAPTPSPAPAPPSFQVVHGIEVPSIDATIALHPGPRCDLDVESPIRPGRLKLEFVNDSHLDGYFRIVRLSPRGALSSVRANPTLHYWGRPRVFVRPSTSRVWSSQRRASFGRWAVVCSKDLIPASNGFHVVPVGVAGPIEIEA